MKREAAARASLMAFLGGLDYNFAPLMRTGGGRGKYRCCWKCGNPTKGGLCHKCYLILKEAAGGRYEQPDLLVTQPDGRTEAINISSPFITPKLDGARRML